MQKLFIVIFLFISTASHASICDQVYAQSERESESFGPWKRTRVVCEMKGAILEKYSLQELKRDLIGLDVGEHLEKCAVREAFSDISGADFSVKEFPQIAFEDRVLRCLAPFRDSHLRMVGQTERPRVYAGIQLIKSDGRYLIETVSKTVRDFWSKEIALARAATILVPGVEIESVDGKSPEELVKDFSRYISGSSSGYVESMAVKSIFLRGFSYPFQSAVRVKVAGSSEELQIPWLSVGINQREDTRRFFKKVGIKSAHTLALDIESKIRDGVDRVGFDEKTSFVSDDKAVKFFDDDGKIGMRMGEFAIGEKNYCYIQILTFATKRWRLNSPAGQPMPFEKPIQLQTTGCENSGRPLILDLRYNTGGDPAMPGHVLAAVGEKNKAYPAMVFSGLMTKHFQDVLAKYDLGEGFLTPDSTTEQGRLFMAYQSALHENKKYLPFVASEPIKSSLPGGFSLPVVALIGPHCVSACDLMAAYLKKSRRAKLLGAPTNGTGGRFVEIGKAPEAGWRDDIYGSISLRIPNSLAGVLPELPAPGEWFFDFDSHRDWVTENKSVLPDVNYSTGDVDLVSGGSGWIEAIDKTFNSEPFSKYFLF